MRAFLSKFTVIVFLLGLDKHLSLLLILIKSVVRNTLKMLTLLHAYVSETQFCNDLSETLTFSRMMLKF